MDQKDTEMNEKRVCSSTSGVVVQVREKKGRLRAAIPYMPFPVAVLCLFLNTFVPGLADESISCMGNSHTTSADYQCDEPLAPKVPPKAPPRAHRSEASKLPHVTFREVLPSSDEETPSTRAHSLGNHAPVPKPFRGMKEATPVPTPEAGKVAGVSPESGTFVSAFAVLCGARTDLPDQHICCVFWLNIAAAFIQILTAVVMVGWIMSIFWGMDMVILASKHNAWLGLGQFKRQHRH
ncbi:hypothetical protein P4O66_008830 [Electrophorus voltai]|uniref:Stum, mechanosensory transduction mediator homolog n=1 Tax=Electrophorus voltai TaxID=2609070 RepID=A0AAD9DUF2_9TELE|nr:hypothetical protein P4O66_008830 [Electrophorus voltai]